MQNFEEKLEQKGYEADGTPHWDAEDGEEEMHTPSRKNPKLLLGGQNKSKGQRAKPGN